MTTLLAGAALVLGLGASVARAGAIEIRHDAVPCVAADLYARLSAAGVPAEQVASAELQFREKPTDGWYAVRMALEGERWSAILPKPARSLARFEYRIVLTDRALQASETQPFGVVVAADEAACTQGPQYSSAVSSPIVIKVPEGAPLMPPVPGGFSPAGVVAALGPKERGPWKAKWITVAGIAGGLAAATAARTDSTAVEPNRDVITIQFIDVVQNTGRIVSLSNPSSLLRMQVSGGPRSPLTLVWRLAGYSPEHAAVCLTTGGVVSLAAAPRPVSVFLASATFDVSPGCGNRFGIETVEVTVTRDGQVVFDDTLTLQMRVQP